MTLRIVTDPGNAPPDEWDWDILLRTATPVQVVSCIEAHEGILPLTRPKKTRRPRV